MSEALRVQDAAGIYARLFRDASPGSATPTAQRPHLLLVYTQGDCVGTPNSGFDDEGGLRLDCAHQAGPIIE
jgi:hypothetical protein